MEIRENWNLVDMDTRCAFETSSNAMYATSTQFLTTMSEPQQSKNSVSLNVMALVKLPQRLKQQKPHNNPSGYICDVLSLDLNTAKISLPATVETRNRASPAWMRVDQQIKSHYYLKSTV